MLLDGLWDPFENWSMGLAAEFIADEYEVTREAMDRFALQSHQKAIAAQEAGKFKAEIVSVESAGRKGETLTMEVDESPRKDSSLESLSKLKPSFKPDGKVTAGNASPMNDGAAAVVIVFGALRSRHATSGRWPTSSGTRRRRSNPSTSSLHRHTPLPKLLKKIGWQLSDVDLIEINEAFAAQVLADGYALG